MVAFFFGLLVLLAGVLVGAYGVARWLEPDASIQEMLQAEVKAMRSTQRLMMEAWRARRDLRREARRRR